MYEIGKTFEFSASHTLDLGPAHPCSRLHGHNYSVTLILRQGELDKDGMVLDYRTLQPFKACLDTFLDHRHLNNVLTVAPTAEHLAKWLYDFAKQLWPQVCAVRVSETARTYAEYREEP